MFADALSLLHECGIFSICSVFVVALQQRQQHWRRTDDANAARLLLECWHECDGGPQFDVVLGRNAEDRSSDATVEAQQIDGVQVAADLAKHRVQQLLDATLEVGGQQQFGLVVVGSAREYSVR